MLSDLVRLLVLQFIGLLSSTLLPYRPLPVARVPDRVEVDFIVIGTGASGSPVAGRLAEISSWKVLVLEAGVQQSNVNKVPGLQLFSMLEGHRDSWGYWTTQQKYGMKGYENKRNMYQRGKVVGGSSATNFMMYVRGNKKDFDRWAELGNSGWDFQSVLPYFKKLENYKGKIDEGNVQYRNKGGPVTISNKIYGTPVMGAFLKAGEEMGYPVIDANVDKPIGFSTPDVTVNDGVRSTGAESYLRPKIKKGNLRLLVQAHVTKILFDNNLRAKGVRYFHNNKMKEAYARKEVIVSGGSINSPQLLMLSGLGPKEHLRQHGIKTLVDLPGVGQNLQDHPSVFGLTWTVDKHKASSFGLILNHKAKAMYRRDRSGPLSAPHGIEGNAFAQLAPGGDPEWADMQCLIMSIHPAIDSGLMLRYTIGYSDKIYNNYFKDLEGEYGFDIGPMLTYGASRGSVTLRSSNPFDAPNIDPNYLSEQEDVDQFVRGIRFALEIGNTTAMRALGAKFYDKPLPGCEDHAYDSDQYWGCYAQHMASTTYHPSCTCKMAPASDPMGVVDERLRVRGVTALRVVDASIMPEITTANTNAPCIMIGEKAADLIKEDHGVL